MGGKGYPCCPFEDSWKSGWNMAKHKDPYGRIRGDSGQRRRIMLIALVLGIALFAVLMLLLSLYDRRRHRLTWWVDAILVLIYLILLTIVVFLTFFSSHPLVGFNWRLILLPIIHLCARIVYILH